VAHPAHEFDSFVLLSSCIAGFTQSSGHHDCRTRTLVRLAPSRSAGTGVGNPFLGGPAAHQDRTASSSVVFTHIIVEVSLQYRQEIADMLNRIIKVALRTWAWERPTHSHNSPNALQKEKDYGPRRANVAARRSFAHQLAQRLLTRSTESCASLKAMRPSGEPHLGGARVSKGRVPKSGVPSFQQWTSLVPILPRESSLRGGDADDVDRSLTYGYGR